MLDEYPDDLELISAAIDGDRDALRELWRANRRWVAAILLAHKARGTDLEDLLQTVALQVCRKIGEVREPEAFRGWLRMVALNAARADGRGVTRKKQGFLRLVGRSHEREASSGPDSSSRAEAAHGLMDLAMKLPEGYREPLLMRCVKGMSYRQIGETMDLPETTIETRIARGRRMLRELASKEEQGSARREPSTAGAV